MNKQFFAMLIAVAAMVLSSQQASAHIAYYSITDVAPDSVVGNTSNYSYHDVVEGNYGWADAADTDLGDSHRANWSKFFLSQTSLVNISVVADPTSQYLFGVPVLLGDLKPGFSVYGGLAPDEAHDGGTILLPDAEGAWNAVDDFYISNDEGITATLDYKGSVGTANGTATSVSWNGVLTSGWYSIAVGGTCYLTNDCVGSIDPEDNNADLINRGFTLTLATTPVPLPGAVWLMFSGLLGFLGLQKRRPLR